MVTVTKIDNKIQVFTSYENVERCRSIPCGKWNKKVGCWEYPLECLLPVIEAFPTANVDPILGAFVKRLRVIDTNVSELVSGKRVPREHDFLMIHQRKCRDIAMFAKKYLFALDTGTGKTLMAYSIIKDRLGARWVVICPKSIIKAAWMADHLRFFPELRVLPMSTNIKKQDYQEIAERWGIKLPFLRAADIGPYLMQHADAVIINPESFKIRKDIQEWGHQGLIVDESSILRDMRSQTTKAVIEHADKMEFAYLMSGKPAPNNNLEYFPQMRVVNRALLGDSYFKFRDTFFRAVDYFGHDFQMIEAMKPEFSRRLSKGCIYISKAECLDLPPDMPPIVRTVELSREAMKYYKQMEKREKILLLEDKSVAAPTKLASLMKLRQITSGFIIDTDADSKVAPLHSAKLDELKTVITELGDNKAVIWINFKREVADIVGLIEKMGKTVVTAYSGTKNVDDSIAAFQKDTAQFIVAHPKTLKYGVTFTGHDMVKNCTYAIYYSMSHSFEDYYQSHDRIYRKGQTEACTFILLIAEGTIDEDICEAVTQKGSNATIMENMIRRQGK